MRIRADRNCLFPPNGGGDEVLRCIQAQVRSEDVKLPITLPRAGAGLTFTAAVIDVASSGSDVPAATHRQAYYGIAHAESRCDSRCPVDKLVAADNRSGQAYCYLTTSDFRNGLSLVLNLSIFLWFSRCGWLADENVCRRKFGENTVEPFRLTRLNMRLDAPSRSGGVALAEALKPTVSTSGMSPVI